MTITYSGEVRTLTQDVVASAADIAAGRQPPSEPLDAGSVEIRPVGRSATIHDGEFSVDVDEQSDALSAFRLLVTTKLADPCGPRACRSERRGMISMLPVAMERRSAPSMCSRARC